MSDRKFEKLVYEFTPEYNEISPEGDTNDFVISPQAYFRGACQIPGAEFNVGFQVFTRPFFLDRFPHRHDKDEYLIFLGGNFPEMFDFDAEIEFTIGKGDDAETYVITQPTIIRLPAGVWHCPLNFKRVDKPVYFQAALMQGVFGGLYDMPDGMREMFYNGPIPCKYDANKRCNTCRACLSEDWRK